METFSGVRRIYREDDNPMHVGGIGVYLVGERELVLIDTGDGNPELTQAIAAEVRARSGSVKTILLTHFHRDHWGGLKEVRRFWPARTFAHPLTIDAIEEEVDFVVEPLSDGESFWVGQQRLRAVHTPGHSPDHFCYLLEDKRVLFTGDTILGRGTTIISDLSAYMESLYKIRALEPKVLAPAHGPIVKNAMKKIAQYIEHREQREARMLKALERVPLSSAELLRRVYRGIDPRLMGAAERNVLTHLDKLCKERKVESQPGANGLPAKFRLVYESTG